ncbi:MAG: hypothetical protein AAF570_27400, partial [Bacteroidota bacterium]
MKIPIKYHAIRPLTLLSLLLLASVDLRSQVITSTDLSMLQAQAIRALMHDARAQDFYLIQYPTQGNFNWVYEDEAGNFNAYTYDYLSGILRSTGTEGLAELAASGTFPNAWMSLLYNTGFRLSTAANARLDSMERRLSTEGGVVLETYEDIFGAVPDLELAAAQVVWGAEYIPTKLDYVINIIVGGEWSCQDTSWLEPLTWAEMATCPNLLDSLACMPDSGGPVVDALLDYIVLLEAVYELQTLLSEGAWTLFCLKANTTQPDAQNGGMQTFDPQTGDIDSSYQVRYGVQKPITLIARTLNDSSHKLFVLLDFSIPDSIHVLAYQLRGPGGEDSLGIEY